LNWIVNEKKIAPHIPVTDKSKREDGTFSRKDFNSSKNGTFISAQAANCSPPITPSATRRHCLPCRAYVLKPTCCPNMPSRRIVRDSSETARVDHAARRRG